MYIIIAGCGKVGSQLASSLSVEGHDVTVIDNDSDRFNQLGSGFNGVTIKGVPLDEDVLKSAGIEKADAIAVVTSDDNMNLTVSQIAKEIYKVPKIITRVYDPDRELIFNQFGLTTICPVTLTVYQIKNLLSQKFDGLWNTFGDKSIHFRFTDPDKKYIGKLIKNVEPGPDRTIFGIIKDDEFRFANPGVRIENNDTLIIAEYV
jgi:trk system potassium uptake protein TrkA